MRKLIKKILKEEIEGLKKENLLTILKMMDDFMMSGNLKDNFFDGSYDGEISFWNLSEHLKNYGFSDGEINFLIGCYYSSFNRNKVVETVDDIITPKKKKYIGRYSVYTSGNQYGELYNDQEYYSPQEAFYDYNNNRNFNTRITNDETEWDDFEIMDIDPEK